MGGVVYTGDIKKLEGLMAIAPTSRALATATATTRISSTW